MKVDEADRKLIAALQSNARKSISDLSIELSLSRATVRTRLEKLINSGEIVGFTIVLKRDIERLAVQAVMLLAIEGKRAEYVTKKIAAMPEAKSIYSTNGKWDLVINITTNDLETFDAVLARIRLIEGVAKTETSMLLTTKKLLGIK